MKILATIAKSYLTVYRIGAVFQSDAGVFEMSFLPKEVREGLDQARKTKQRKKSRMRVKSGDQTVTILRYWDAGFALDADDAPHLRGLVDVFDGARHLSQCLIVASEENSGEMVFEFKRATPHADRPAADYEVLDGPVALIGHRPA